MNHEPTWTQHEPTAPLPQFDLDSDEARFTHHLPLSPSTLALARLSSVPPPPDGSEEDQDDLCVAFPA